LESLYILERKKVTSRCLIVFVSHLYNVAQTGATRGDYDLS
jgi:hypothetical protein